MAVTGKLGTEDIVLSNAAQEETLARILAIMSSANNANSPEYQKLLAQSASSASQSIKQSGQSVKGLGLEADEARFGIGGLGRAATGAKRYMDSFGASMTAMGNTLSGSDPYGMATGLLNTTSQLAGSAVEGFGAALGPVGSMLGGLAKAGIGAAAALTGVFIGAMSKTTQEFNKMQAGGALFGGDLIATRRAAHGAGVTMEQMSGIVSKAGQSLAMFGGQTSRGARDFGKANSQLIASQGDQMLRMGIGYEEMGIRTAEYMETLALSNQRMGTFGTEAADVAAGTARLAKQQKMMSALNGESIEAEKAKQKAVRQDAAFQAAISKMSVGQRTEMEALMKQFPHLSGAIKEAALTGEAFSAESLMAVEGAGHMGGYIMDAVRNVREGVDVGQQLSGVYERAEANADLIAKDREAAADMASMSIFGTGNAMVEAYVGQFNQLTEASIKANTQAFTHIKTDMETLQGSASAATNAMTDVAKEFQNAQVNVSRIFTEFLDSGGGKVMIDAVTLPIKALGVAIQTATNAITGDGELQEMAGVNTTRASKDADDAVTAKRNASELIALADKLADIQARAATSMDNKPQMRLGATSSSVREAMHAKYQAESLEFEAEQQKLADEAEKVQQRMMELQQKDQAQAEQQDPSLVSLNNIHKALVDQTDALTRAISTID
jgi:hypothetical protein